MKYPLLGPLLVALLLGSVSVRAADPLPTRDLRPLLNEPVSEYVINRKFDAHLQDSCLVTHLELAGRDPVDGSTQLVWFYTYQPMRETITEGKALIQPPTGGITNADRWFAETLCDEGVPTALVDTWSGYLEADAIDFGTHDRAAVRAIATMRYVIDYLKAPVVLMGTSLGAIYSSMVMGLDLRVIGAVLIVGGGPLPDFLTHSDQEIMVNLRNRRLQAFSIGDTAEYGRILRENVRINPGDFASPARRGDLLMVVGGKDTTVQTSAQVALWEAWGRPARIDYPLDHFNTIVGNYLVERVLNFIGFGRVVEFMSDRAHSAIVQPK